LFADAGLGGHWMPDPDEETRARYNILFALLEAAINGQKPDPKWAETPAQPPNAADDTPVVQP
jgi:hypothetical protein